MTEEKTTHGGARKGAGRKPTGKKYHIMSVTGKKEELDAIRELAKTSNKSISRFIIDTILKKEN